MTQAQFLRALSRRLRGVSEAEREEALRYYKEFLQEADLEPKADVTPLVGTPEECARGILADSQIRQTNTAAAAERRESSTRVLLAILLAPVAFVVFVTLIAFFASGVGLALGGVLLPFLAIGATGPIGQLLIILGYGLLMIAVGVLMIVAVIVLWRLTVRGCAAVLHGKGESHA